MPKILIVEDEANTAHAMKTWAESLMPGAEVEVCTSAAEAREFVHTCVPDFISSDMSMVYSKAGADFLNEIDQDPRFRTTKLMLYTSLDPLIALELVPMPQQIIVMKKQGAKAWAERVKWHFDK